MHYFSVKKKKMELHRGSDLYYLMYLPSWNCYCLDYNCKYASCSGCVCCRLEELTVIDIQFLHGCTTPTLILIHQVKPKSNRCNALYLFKSFK